MKNNNIGIILKEKLSDKYEYIVLDNIIGNIVMIVNNILSETECSIDGIILSGSTVTGKHKKYSDYDFQLLLGGNTQKGFHKSFLLNGNKVEIIAESESEIRLDFINERKSGIAPTIGTINDGIILLDRNGKITRYKKLAGYIWEKRGPKLNEDIKNYKKYEIINLYFDLIDINYNKENLSYFFNKAYNSILELICIIESIWIVSEKNIENLLICKFNWLQELLDSYNNSSIVDRKKYLIKIYEYIINKYSIDLNMNFKFEY